MIIQIVNEIGKNGADMISQALLTNTLLIQLNMEGSGSTILFLLLLFLLD